MSKRGIVSRGVIAIHTSVYPPAHTAIPRAITKCYPPILQQLLPFSRGGLLYCKYCQESQNWYKFNRVLPWSSFGMLTTIQVSWEQPSETAL